MYKQAVTSVTDSMAQTLMLNSEGSHACNSKYTQSPSEKIRDTTTLFAVVLWYYLAAVL